MPIRPFVPSDTAAVAALWHATWHEAHGALFSPEIVAMRTPETFLKRLAPLAAGILVAEIDNTVVGFAALEHNEVDQFYVAPSVRGTGLAATLLAAAEAELARRGVADAVIQCTTGNTRAYRFYSKSGWSDSGIANLPIWMPDSRMIKHPTHVLKKRLIR
ncbi:GNAT family N-acetyltransferase [Oryzibacter oryziterrae]|uniref:GNAT family N-acetyltransferase n=1 Tax=Oryzibacter oryziterrae TaxID=2766474 RepID=UPI001F41359C|nr:GNAT family N-acetyltransferase [Oryzibacter oryziterrae]